MKLFYKKTVQHLSGMSVKFKDVIFIMLLLYKTIVFDRIVATGISITDDELNFTMCKFI